MTTASTNTTIANNSNVNFQAWVNEIYTAFVTTCGLTQSADTGQMAVPCVTALPAASTVGGFYMFQFNDALQATSPVFIKMEFGQGSTTTTTGTPLIIITVGSSTNGAGTITGTLLARSSQSQTQGGVVAGGGVTNYVSRFCYNASQGFLGMAWKIGSGPLGNTYDAYAGFMLYRSVDNTGAPTAVALNALYTAYNTITATTSSGTHAYLDYSTSVAGQLSVAGNFAWIPGTITTTVQGTTGQVFPIIQWAPTATVPGAGITNAVALGVNAEISLGATVVITVIGSLSLTYINVGQLFGSNTISTPGAYGAAQYGFLMLWQ